MSDKTITIYPTTIKPDYTTRKAGVYQNKKCDGTKNCSGYQQMSNYENICQNNDEIAYWGDQYPDKGSTQNPLRYFPNTVTSFNGSYNIPSAFNAYWDFKDIKSTAKIKKIVVHYRLAHIRYQNASIVSNGKRIDRSYISDGGVYYYDELTSRYKTNAKKKSQTNFIISLNNFDSQTLSAQGNGLHINQRINKNYDKYSINDIPEYQHVLYNNGNGNFTISRLAQSYIRFSLPRQLNDDLSRIVMRDLWLEITYESTPSQYSTEINISKTTLTNCSDDFTTITFNAKSSNGIAEDSTEIKIDGTAIDYATNLEDAKDFIINTDNNGRKYLLWTPSTNKLISGDSKTLILKYEKTGSFNLNATVLKYSAPNGSKSSTITVNSCKPTFAFDFLDQNENNINSDFAPLIKGRYIFSDYDEKQGIFKISFKENQFLNHTENITINLNDLRIQEQWDSDNEAIGDRGWYITYKDNNNTFHDISNEIRVDKIDNNFVFSSFDKYVGYNIYFKCKPIFDTSGEYTIRASYNNLTNPEWSQYKYYNITVKGIILGKEYFKLRLEDGSDVRYNSLMITEGDDLLNPLTYTTKEVENYIDNLIITGEKKRIPVGETQYIKFDILLDTKEEINLKNVLTYIDVYRSDELLDNVIIGAGKGVSLLKDNICSIDSISSTETTTIKLAVKSDIEVEDVEIRIKPFNYDKYTDNGGWTPAHIMFKNIPNIKMSIEGISDLQYDENNENDGYFWLYYGIENASDTTGKNIRFQIKEPSQFKKIQYKFKDEDSSNNQAPWFNSKNRIISFPKLEANSKKYIIAIQYKATKKGIYNFIIKTLDDLSTLEDDQYANSCQHELMVNIDADVRVQTDVTNSLPYVYDLIDFHINVKNFYKNQKEFIFEIYDIGAYEPTTHNSQDYYIEYVNCPHGTFSPIYDEHDIQKQYPNAHDGNKVGTWVLKDIKAGDEYDLTLSVRPQDIGNHFFKTIFINNTTNKNTHTDLYNEVKVLEKNKQIEFDAYHAVDDTGKGCKDCDALTRICDDDFINLDDDIYYVIEIKNNSRNDITNTIHAYARLPESFLTNTILCSSHKYLINQDNNLISFSIPKLNGCNKDNSTIKICFKVKPSEIGEFDSTFTLVTRNSKILYKHLKLIVDTEFNEKRLEHEISIYNFEKTNRYYRYEIDSLGDIYKFFNTGDKTYRPIDIETYNKSAVETYRGHNLREIVRNIKKYSKYVDPVLFREGDNGFKDKAYELYPDGLIRRFGLLNSEVFHYSHQFPETTDLVLKAMKWDIDNWDTKAWASDIYNNGVFDLTIDYSKIPTNFNILEVDNPIKVLQNLVDNTKPYGTKAICYYSATVEAAFAVNIDSVNTCTNYNIKANINILNDFDLTSAYNRHDNSLAIYHDLMKASLDIEADILHTYIDDRTLSKYNSEKLQSNIKEIDTSIYSDTINKQYTNDCFDLISNTYNTPKGRTIDITKPYNNFNTAILINDNTEESYLTNTQFINLTNNLLNKEIVGLIIKPYQDTAIYTCKDENNITISDDRSILNDDSIKCIFYRDDINSFNGFQFIVNGKVQQQRNIYEKVENISIQIQKTTEESNTILHFWGSINNKKYYHIGYSIINDIKEPIVTIYNTNTKECNIERYTSEEDYPISFQISDDTNIISKDFSEIKAIENKNKWNYLNRINKGHNKYAYFENSIDIDPECLSRKINIPKLVFKYDNFDLTNHEEITDIKFRLQAQSNKKNFENDININLYKNGDAYIPKNNIAKEIHYPSYVENVNQEFITTINVEEPNMTICSKCLKTSLGYYESCPHCGSSIVSHHEEPHPATACHNCGWIIDGWNEYCTHCLSYNTTKIQIDFNKTYCTDCGNISNDYYQRCPKCFSKNIQHLTNTTNRYTILGEDSQNIEPITIQGDLGQSRINVVNLSIPLNYNTLEIEKLNYLTLHLKGHNNNTGKYYYCEACEKGGLGNYDKCPDCTSDLIHNYETNGITLEMYPQINGKTYTPNNITLTKDFEMSIPLYEKDNKECYAKQNQLDKFKLSFYIENKLYEQITDDILKLPIDFKYQSEILNVLLFDLAIDNFYFDYEYIDEQEWTGLDKLEGENHTYIHYDMSNNSNTSDAIHFDKFNIKNGEYLNNNLYINGVMKKSTKSQIETSPTIIVTIDNGGEVTTHKEIIRDTLFNYKLNLNNLIGKYLKDISIKISFDNVIADSINITDVYIITQKRQYKDNIHDNINEISAKITKENNYYLIESLNNNLWGINNEAPYYLSGNQLDTSLIAYIDFGKLELEEYLRVYNIEMLVYYKTKTGQIVTYVISPDNDKTLQAIKNSNEKLIQNGKQDKIIDINKIDETNVEQILTGEIIQKNSEILGSVDYPTLDLNNLDSEVTNINENDDLVNDIPLYYKLAQSFIATSSTISTASFNYFGKRGYPNDIIKAYLCKDDENEPGAIIQTCIVQVNGTNVLNIEFNVYDLIMGEQYWIILEDTSADENNYHRFRYNNNTLINITNNDEVKEINLHLIHYTNKTSTHDTNSVLSFAINRADSLDYYWSLPATWHLDSIKYEGYKLKNTLYRYNVNDNNNAILSNFKMKSGYYFREW